MTVFDILKSKNIDELVDWFDEHWISDCEPWIAYWDENYCKKCDGVFFEGMEYGWCELNNYKCKFFQNMDKAPDNKQMIKLWLESEI